jgi:hypothetical protein
MQGGNPITLAEQKEHSRCAVHAAADGYENMGGWGHGVFFLVSDFSLELTGSRD